MAFWLAIGAGAYLVYFYKISGNATQARSLNQVERRNYDSGMLYDVFMGLGQILEGQGSDDENMGKKVETLSFNQVQNWYTRKHDMQGKLLHGQYTGEPIRQITKRQQFSGPSDEVQLPLMCALSGWYDRSTATNRVPYVTRIVPAGAVPGVR